MATGLINLVAVTVNKISASGMKAVALAAQAIKAGDAEVIVAGGIENMSSVPYYVPKMRWGARMFNAELVDGMVYDGLWEIFYNYHMGVTSENIAEKYGITREEQDQFALQSHQKAVAAQDAGHFAEEIVPLKVPQRKGDPLVFDADEGPRRDTSLERLARLRPVFTKEGTVTAILHSNSGAHSSTVSHRYYNLGYIEGSGYCKSSLLLA